MKIYWIKAQAPRRVLALAKYLGLNAATEQLDLVGLKRDDYLAMNPNGKAPTLVDGDTVLWESSAIMAYLCIKAGSDMWPARDPAEQVQVMRWLSWNDCHWAREVGNYYFEHIVKATFNIGPPDRALLEPKAASLHKWAKVLDDHLADKDFVACNRLTIADFHLAAMATDWREAEMPLANFANIVRWIDRLKAIPAWANPWPA
jgi:glutathione S-transferase